MRSLINYKKISLLLFFVSFSCSCFAHEIFYCGERIPVSDNFVSTKLMEVIRTQVPMVNMIELRKRVNLYFPTIEYYLRQTGLPDDLKYIAIVESCFLNVTSKVGAKGIWQLMPETALGKGLVIKDDYDEREDFRKSTYTACQVLADSYKQIKRDCNIYSWVLTTAAYNIGIGRMIGIIKKQGNNYFSMSLNAETALYLYKVIAVKELFEHPEHYMQDFGYNVFSAASNTESKTVNQSIDSSLFNSMQINVAQKNDVIHPDKLNTAEPPKPTNADLVKAETENLSNTKFKYLSAVINEKYKTFKDGDLITIRLGENLEVNGSFNRKGNLLKGNGWVIDNRVFIDLGRDILLFDITGKKGISLTDLKKKEPVLLKIKMDNNVTE